MTFESNLGARLDVKQWLNPEIVVVSVSLVIVLQKSESYSFSGSMSSEGSEQSNGPEMYIKVNNIHIPTPASDFSSITISPSQHS